MTIVNLFLKLVTMDVEIFLNALQLILHA